MFNPVKKKKIDFVRLPPPDDTTYFFEQIKHKSETLWLETDINVGIYGYQIQSKSVWKPGLNESELKEFETAMGIEFPLPLKNFYKTMNGLTKAGINVFGNDGTAPAFKPVFYSYPDDLLIIKDLVRWIYQETLVDENAINDKTISSIFPIFMHRCMLMNIKGNPILSMHGSDIIYWNENLSRLLANEIFDNIYNVQDFETNPEHQPDINFWLD